MLFPHFEKYKIQSPRLAELLPRLEQYLEQRLRRPENDRDLYPEVVSGVLQIPFGQLMGLLQIAQTEKILVPRVDFYCPETEVYLDSVLWPDPPPEEYECPEHSFPTVHSYDDLERRLVYEFTPEAVNSILMVA